MSENFLHANAFGLLAGQNARSGKSATPDMQFNALRRHTSELPDRHAAFASPDVAERGGYEAGPIETAELLRVTLENIIQGIIYYGPDQRVRVHNVRAQEILGLPSHILRSGAHMRDVHGFLKGQGEFADDVDYLGRMVVSGDPSSVPKVFERVRPNGTTIEIRGTQLHDGGVVWTFTDITQRKAAEARIEHMALHDALTGLPNRVLFGLRLDRAVKQATAYPSRNAVLALDLDRFKLVNDSYGHAAGDQLLCIVAERLGAVVPAGGTVARLGGDEFAVILTDLGRDAEVIRVCESIVATLGEPFPLDSAEVEIGVSVGGALLLDDGASADEILRRADMALFEAKAAGRGTYCMYEKTNYCMFENAAHTRGRLTKSADRWPGP
ncbi:diguanylate cyclase (GGDEF)-like protein [Methylorubrum rhodinum]|uniref:Diguanylate cyclase (GGDEF)-like protein n=1 Tax=Methylorubrum rhodinum TaxID=29428 RepID=A0A840ZFE4_9HYPH|nr:diguanylate cyclase [Methylorubrum rhodinum]MBB5756459.1 diguanylate cyclase (GGDEF)-like protein [Methylorubrum rhodinum]